MEVLIGKSLINGPFSIAMFDYPSFITMTKPMFHKFIIYFSTPLKIHPELESHVSHLIDDDLRHPTIFALMPSRYNSSAKEQQETEAE